MFQLPPPTEEQEVIIQSIKTHNVIVNAVAGSGKTTTNLLIAVDNPDKRILILTYNKRLKLDTKRKITALGLTNVEAHSYHAFCVRYYSRLGYTDRGLSAVLSQRDPDRFSFDIIIVDECQDVNQLYFKFIKKIISDNSIIPWLCLLGDPNQSIYAYNGADPRYLTLADQLLDGRPWCKLTLSISFRLTDETSEFINRCIFGYEKIRTDKPTRKRLCYYIYKKPIEIFNEVLRQLTEYDVEDIFVLTPSVRKAAGRVEKPIRVVANLLTKRGIPIHISTSDEENLTDEIMRGKIVFSTFHQVKGLERKVVIMDSFGAEYFKFYARNVDQKTCPNPIYVAITRPTEQLILFRNARFGPFQFVNELLVHSRFGVRGHIRYVKNSTENVSQSEFSPFPIGVTDLIRHLDFFTVRKAINYFTRTLIQEKSTNVGIPCNIKSGTLTEDVSEINGTAIPACYEYFTKETFSIKEDGFIEPFSIEKLLRYSNEYCSEVSGYKFKLAQIQNYNWLTQDKLDQCLVRMRIISTEANYEIKVSTDDFNNKLRRGGLRGRIDCIDDENVFEIKCTSSLKDIHFIQLAIYMYLNNNYRQQYKLFNVYTNEIYRIDSTRENLYAMISFIIDNKNSYGESTDEDFIEENTEHDFITFIGVSTDGLPVKNSMDEYYHPSEVQHWPNLTKFEYATYKDGQKIDEYDGLDIPQELELGKIITYTGQVSIDIILAYAYRNRRLDLVNTFNVVEPISLISMFDYESIPPVELYYRVFGDNPDCSIIDIYADCYYSLN